MVENFTIKNFIGVCPSIFSDKIKMSGQKCLSTPQEQVFKVFQKIVHPFQRRGWLYGTKESTTVLEYKSKENVPSILNDMVVIGGKIKVQLL
jgi:hypothetical protein